MPDNETNQSPIEAQQIDQFARELAVALRRILGLTDDFLEELPSVAEDPEPSSLAGEEVES